MAGKLLMFGLLLSSMAALLAAHQPSQNENNLQSPTWRDINTKLSSKERRKRQTSSSSTCISFDCIDSAKSILRLYKDKVIPIILYIS